MRVAVMGAGGMGGFFGGLLAKAGEDVTFIARGSHLETIRNSGLQVRSILAGDFQVDAQVTDDPSTIGLVDFVLFCVKMYDTVQAAEQIRPLIGADTLVASTQNGVDGEAIISDVIGQDHVLGATATVSSIIVDPGVVDQRGGPGLLKLGELSGADTPRVRQLVERLQDSGLNAQLAPDIPVEIWQKFAFICGLSGVTALTRLPIGGVLSTPSTRQVLVDTMSEVVSVAAKSGVTLPAGTIQGAIDFLDSVEPSVRGSMAYDLEAGKRLELGSLNGKVVELGREHGVPTPVNSVITSALEPFSDGPPGTGSGA